MSSMYGASPMAGPTGKTGNKTPSGYKLGQTQQFTPDQMELFQQMFGQVGPESFLSKIAGGDEAAFGELEAPALKQFSGIQGGIASRFSGMGSGGRKSSGFQNTINQAGSDFASQLQSQRMGLRSQALKDLMGYSNKLLGQKPYENELIKKDQSSNGWGSIAGSALGGLAGFFSPIPGGAAAGAKLGYDVGSQF